MPIYAYECPVCGNRFERLQPVTAEPVEICPNCGNLARRILQPVGIIFKGSGFYSTDHRSLNQSKDKPAEVSDAKEKSAQAGDGKETKATE